METIICSAIWYKELPTQTYPPKNITFGLVVCGLRHPHCIDVVKSLSGLRTVKFGPDSVGETVQGFLTNTNRFVDRKEAKEIAINSGQIDPDKHYSSDLFSEDIY